MPFGKCCWEGDTGSTLSTLGAPLWLHRPSGAAKEDGGIFLWIRAFPQCSAVPKCPVPVGRAGERSGSGGLQLAQPLLSYVMRLFRPLASGPHVVLCLAALRAVA